MKLYFTLALLVLSIGSAHAEQLPAYPIVLLHTEATTHTILPPLEYDHPYKGKLTINVVRNAAEMEAACAGLPKIPGGRASCAEPSTSRLMAWLRGKEGRKVYDSCVIHIRNDKDLRAMGWAPEIIRRHEIGHCNGWPGDHKGGRPAP